MRQVLVNERRGRIQEHESQAFLRLLTQLPIMIQTDFDQPRLMSLARVHRLTAYDAAYLELAERHHCPLASLDQALMRAAQALHLPALNL